jgi:hypothetical protein
MSKVRLRTKIKSNTYSYCIGVFGGIIVGEDFLEYFNHPSPGMQGFVTSVYGKIKCFAVGVLCAESCTWTQIWGVSLALCKH